jgi:ethanolamine transporter EutH
VCLALQRLASWRVASHSSKIARFGISINFLTIFSILVELIIYRLNLKMVLFFQTCNKLAGFDSHGSQLELLIFLNLLDHLLVPFDGLLE